jgi:hypothetical protein
MVNSFYYVSIHNTFGETCGTSLPSEEILVCSLAENYASTILKKFDKFEDMSAYMMPSSIYYMRILCVELEKDLRLPTANIVRLLKEGVMGKELKIHDLNKDLFFEKYNYWLQVYQDELYSRGGLPYWCDNFVTMEKLIIRNFPLPFDYLRLDKETASTNYDDTRSGDFDEEYALFLEKMNKRKQKID